MGTKLTRSPQQWMETITECRKSGLTDRQWCDAHGIASSTFYYHLRKLQASPCEIPKKTALEKAVPQIQEVVPLTIIEPDPLTVRRPSAAADPAIQLDFNGFHLEIRNHASADAILGTLKALRQLC